MSSMTFSKSIEALEAARDIVPSGANSPGRLFSEVDTPALVIDSAEGATVRDIDGNTFVDFVMGLGPCLLGHAHPEVSERIKAQVDRGTVYGMSSPMEYELARRIVDTSPALDALRFTCSGTEAVMTALRVARAHTGRAAILKFTGGYHGHADCALAKASKGAIRHKVGEVADGIPVAEQLGTFIGPYNDAEEARRLVEEHHERLAAVIVEPVATNMGLILPDTAFLGELRALCDRFGIVLIFDEVVSGFRFGFGPVSKKLGVVPDLTTFGKIIGGGISIGAYGGKSEIMEAVSQKGGVFQGGTFAGNPLAMAAGLAALDVLEGEGFYEDLYAKAARFASVTRECFEARGIGYAVQQFGPLASYIFNDTLTRLNSFADVERQDASVYARFHHQMVQRGFLFPPTIEEPIFFSAAHTNEQVVAAAEAGADVLADILPAAGTSDLALQRLA